MYFIIIQGSIIHNGWNIKWFYNDYDYLAIIRDGGNLVSAPLLVLIVST